MRRNLIILIIIILFLLSCTERKFNNPAEPNLVSETLKAPTNLSIYVADENILELTWDDNSETEDRFLIYRSINSEDYKYYKTIPANTTIWQDSKVELGKTYAYRIYAANEDYRAADAAESAFVYSLYTPSDFKIEAYEKDIIELSWQDNNHFEEGYQIDRKTGNVQWEEAFATVPADSTYWAFSADEPNDLGYTWRVRAFYKTIKSTATSELSLTVADPILSVESGDCSEDFMLSISCETADAQIRYTIDGSTPTPNSTLYSGSILIDSNTRLKVKAFINGWHASNTIEANYSFQVADPVLSVEPGTHSENFILAISCATDKAQIRYTTDGSMPTMNSNLYTTAIKIDSNTILRAKAFKTGWHDSNMVEATYSFIVSDPIFSIPAGTYGTPQSVLLGCATAKAQIRYTTDGTVPVSSSALYSAAIEIDSNTTLKARAFKSGWNSSNTISQKYIFKVATPKFSLPSGVYNTPQSVSINCNTPGAIIRYTLDGSTPTSSSIQFTQPIFIDESTTINARAFKENWDYSTLSTVSYSFVIDKVSTPIIKPPGGQFLDPQTVRLYCSTKDATIRYTIDGSDPTSSSPIYKKSLEINANTILKAKAFKDGWLDSDISSSYYTFNVATPTFNPDPGFYAFPQNVTISCNTDGAVIRYTIDGSNPTESSAIYDGAIYIDTDMIIKAKVFKTGWNSSAIITGSYNFIPENMVYAPAGTFIMGRTHGDGDEYELPMHYVTLNHFFISPFEVTSGEFEEIMGYNPGYPPGENRPIFNVSWYTVVKYCNLRSIAEGFTPAYTLFGSTNPTDWGEVPTTQSNQWDYITCNWEADGYRLPTEAEWEYAARGASNSPDYTYSGSYIVDDVAWYSQDNLYYCKPVGLKAPNGLGLFDMSGNVREYCWDWYNESYYSISPQDNPKGPENGQARICRGGAWNGGANGCRVAYRLGYYPYVSGDSIGFRVCRSIPQGL